MVLSLFDRQLHIAIEAFWASRVNRSSMKATIANRNQYFFGRAKLNISIRYIETPKKLPKSIQNVNKIIDFDTIVRFW